ncbi:magnesium and cobalt transport protein CorA [Corynebacterium uberis]|uniref:magnesium and cobalt transport protein CorA n=1 Tax=Corynebacterium TaxID=1716 RepID=UPI001D0A1B96|nr:magnesium and cobalt transport protein CorA [Corynebacterium uberis]MCZ9308690.1 magnesium and cobalt transport protein CorA [Corynebacterium sp. c6VSa_13]UDL74329.1 magnesium and cobalt transport protein CorA [Corynebacterium uberis]UDL76838.1 magnesium and cobalt transport protein CorA [Corynebacterium uberis]UDL79051.1 magnesium and cobalt transport protein CorA [Corynebacterium uberis]UDL79289.1 magnesium and cobalt transport protein CorA [Corynebacterium uberis]
MSPTFPRPRNSSSGDSAHRESRLRIPVERAIEHCRIFRDGTRLPGEHTVEQAIEEVRAHGGFVWLALREPNDTQMARVALKFDIDELVAEDAVSAHQRPKVERYGDQLFIVVRSVTYRDADAVKDAREIIETGELQMLIGSHFIITVRHGADVPGLLEHMDRDLELEDTGPLALAWSAADHLVEEYGRIADLLEREVDEIEEEVFTPDSDFQIEQIYMLKREILEMRHSVAPLVSALTALTTRLEPQLPAQLSAHFRDVLDNTAIAREQITSFDERLTALVDAAVAKITLQQNQDMRRLSVLVGMITVPTLIAGIYGMNFDEMPELHWMFGYPAAIGLMVLSVTIIYWVCHRRHYI